MIRKWRALTVVAAAVAIAGLFCAAGGQEPTQTLPGAQPVIDAGRFPTIQAAINALGESGGVVKIPPGTFQISEPLIVLKSDVTIRGCGTATHYAYQERQYRRQTRPYYSARKRGRESKSRDMARSTGGPENYGQREERARNRGAPRKRSLVFIDGVTVSYHGGDGIRLHHCYEDPRICDSLITYNKQTGLNLIGCHDIIVASNQFEENHDALHCTDGFNLCMTGNNLDDHLGDGVVIANTYGSVVSGNMIEECKGTAIVLDRDCYGIALSANVIAHNNAGGIDLRDAHGCAVSANAFTIMGKDALRIGPNSGRITVTGNNFSDSYIGDGKVKRAPADSAAGGIVTNGATDLAIVGNLFSSLRPKALAAEGPPSKSVLFTANVLVDTQADSDKFDKSLIENNLGLRR